MIKNFIQTSLTLAALVLLTSSQVFAHAPRTLVTLSEDDDDDDQVTITLMYNTLMSAETIAETLDAELNTMSTASGLLVFGIQSPENRHIRMTLSELGGETKLADREFDINAGNSYRALNVSELPVGNYILTIEENGKKKTQLVGVVSEN